MRATKFLIHSMAERQKICICYNRRVVQSLNPYGQEIIIRTPLRVKVLWFQLVKFSINLKKKIGKFYAKFWNEKKNAVVKLSWNFKHYITQ